MNQSSKTSSNSTSSITFSPDRWVEATADRHFILPTLTLSAGLQESCSRWSGVYSISYRTLTSAWSQSQAETLRQQELLQLFQDEGTADLPSIWKHCVQVD